MLELFFAAALFADATPKGAAELQPRKVAAAAKGGNEAVLAGVAVTLECTARASGRVENCQVLGETHPGMGLAQDLTVLHTAACAGCALKGDRDAGQNRFIATLCCRSDLARLELGRALWGSVSEEGGGEEQFQHFDLPVVNRMVIRNFGSARRAAATERFRQAS